MGTAAREASLTWMGGSRKASLNVLVFDLAKMHGLKKVPYLDG